MNRVAPDQRELGVDLLTKIRGAGNVNAVDVLRKGLEDLSELCNIVISKFTQTRDDFVEEEMQ